MPRPVKDNPRDHFKTFRFTEAEVTRLEGRARSRGQTLSDYVRSALLGVEAEAGTASEPNPKPGPRDHALKAVADQMRRAGVNLNQIARRMNEQRIPPPRELTGLLHEIRVYVRQAQEP